MSQPMATVPRTGSIEGVINITNLGNGRDTFIISIGDDEGIVKDINLTEEVTIWVLYALVPFRIEVDFGDKETGVYSISINVTSKGSLENETSPISSHEANIQVRNVPSDPSIAWVLALGTASFFIIAIVFILINKYKLKGSP
jgi:hypothetical protein